MTVTLPEKLVRHKDIEFDVVPATILKVAQWSDTHVHGGGGGGHYYHGHGSSHINAVTSTVVQKANVWFELSNGKEWNYVFSGEAAMNTALREGNRVDLITSTLKDDENRLCAVVNYTTDRWSVVDAPIPHHSGSAFFGMVGAMIALFFFAAALGDTAGSILALIALIGGPWTMIGMAKENKANSKAIKHISEICKHCMNNPEEGTANMQGTISQVATA